MAGRPKNPDYTVPTWAPDANYPAGASAWSATPTKVAHPGAASVGFTPRAGVPAQCVNQVVSAGYAVDAAAKVILDQLTSYVGQANPLNWKNPVANPLDGDSHVGIYEPVRRRWLIAGEGTTTEDVRASYDNGQTWSGGSLVSSVGLNPPAICKHMASDAAGNAVIGSDAAYIFMLSVSDVPQRINVFLGNTENIRVAYAPTADLFVASTYDALSTFLKTSADQGATWTDRSGTLPAQWGDWSTYAGLTRLLFVSNGSTRLVCVGQGYANGIGPSGVGTCRAMTSDDGGITWTDRGTFATTISSPTRQDLAWNETTAEYMYTIGEGSGTPTGEVWTSPDGITWTKQATFTSASVTHVAQNGNQWVGVASYYEYDDQAEVVYSNDDGVTWRFAGGVDLVSGGTNALAAGGGGLLIVAPDRSWASLRMGQPDLGTLT